MKILSVVGTACSGTDWMSANTQKKIVKNISVIFAVWNIAKTGSPTRWTKHSEVNRIKEWVMNRIEQFKKFIKLWEAGERDFSNDIGSLEILEVIKYLNDGIKVGDLKCCGNCHNYFCDMSCHLTGEGHNCTDSCELWLFYMAEGEW